MMLGPPLYLREDETSSKHQHVDGSMNDTRPYAAPKEDTKIYIKSHCIATCHE